MQLIRGELLYFIPGSGNSYVTEYISDGGLLIDAGKVVYCGAWRSAYDLARPDTLLIDYSGKLILPGFIDTHIHYTQTDIIASPGHELLDWLTRYTFPAEQHFAEVSWGREVATFFCTELLRNGTTTAVVFGSVHPESVDALFQVADAQGMRMAVGKVMMDRHCPESLQDTAQSAYDDSKRLLDNWRNVGRLQYAITPRFAITSSAAQLEVASALARQYPEALIQTHLAENPAEVEWVKRLFPQARSYLDVYAHYDLLRPGSIFAHCIYLNDHDRSVFAERGASVAFCPTSNLFLGSGLFDLQAAQSADMRVAIATDVGGGSSFSMLRTMGAAYQVARLQGYELAATHAFYLATLAGARAMGKTDCIGSFLPGREADFIVLDPDATALLSRRMKNVQSLEEKLFLWLMLGDDRAIAATYIMGQMKWRRPDNAAE